MTELANLNITKNVIYKIDGLENCKKLSNLNISFNKLGKYAEKDNIPCVESLLGLISCPSITTLDLQNNYITDANVVEEILEKLPNLAVLYLKGNPFIRKIKNYRKTLIARIPSLTYLDDRPIEEAERRRAYAFAEGNEDAEKLEMIKIKQEAVEKREVALTTF